MSSLDFDLDTYPADEPAANLLERRWFAAGRAAAEVQSECDQLEHVLDLAQDAWRAARARLSQLEALRDALGEELAAMDGMATERVAAA